MIAAILGFLLSQANPDVARFQAAQGMQAEGRCGDAISTLEELAGKHPEVAAIQFALGRCRFDRNEYVLAQESLARAVAAAPDSAEARYYFGCALGMARKLPEAIEQLRIATSLDPKFAPAFRVLGMFRVRAGQLVPETRLALERAIQLDPQDARAHYWLGRFCLDKQDPDAAATHFGRALQLQPESTPARLGYGQALDSLGEAERALVQFDVVLQRDPASGAALLGRAKCLYHLEQYEPGLAAALAVQEKSDDAETTRGALWILSRLFRALEKGPEAQAAEKQLAKLEADFNAELARFRRLQEQAMGYKTEGALSKVVETLEQALTIQERQDSLLILGDAYLGLGRSAEAERCFLRAGQAGPETPEITVRLREARERSHNAAK